MDAGEHLAAQRDLYGEPIGDTTARIVAALGLTQARLAQVLQISAPMMSQLISGQRVKIGNPAVVQRLASLAMLAEDAPRLSPGQIQDRLEAIRDEQVTLTGSLSATARRASAVGYLRTVATGAQLTAAAEAAAAAGAPDLARVLTEAATDSHG